MNGWLGSYVYRADRFYKDIVDAAQELVNMVDILEEENEALLEKVAHYEQADEEKKEEDND